MITLEQAKKLQYGQVLHHVNADKTPLRVTVKGSVKTWKRDPERIRIPLKYGLYRYGYLVNNDSGGNTNGFILELNEVTL